MCALCLSRVMLHAAAVVRFAVKSEGRRRRQLGVKLAADRFLGFHRSQPFKMEEEEELEFVHLCLTDVGKFSPPSSFSSTNSTKNWWVNRKRKLSVHSVSGSYFTNRNGRSFVDIKAFPLILLSFTKTTTLWQLQITSRREEGKLLLSEKVSWFIEGGGARESCEIARYKQGSGVSIRSSLCSAIRLS